MSESGIPQIDDAVLDRMVEAAMEASRNHLLERVAAVPFDTSDFVPFFRGLEGESERALAIVSFSYIDEKLQQLMRLEMNGEVSGGLDSLFENFGPLSTASARIKVSAASFWLNRGTYQDLEILRKIRNAFAHRPFVAGFGERSVAGLLSSLRPVEDSFISAVPSLFPQGAMPSARLRFHVRAMMTCHHMMCEVLTAPKALRLGLSPTSALERGFDGLPDKLRDFARDATRAALEMLAPSRVLTPPASNRPADS